MTTLWGNDNGGGGSGSNGHRVVVDYTITQDAAAILGNYSLVSWQYGVDYGDPNYWNNIDNRSITWSLNTGASVAAVSGSGLSFSSAPVINTTDPGYGGQIHYFASGVAKINHNASGVGIWNLAASMRFNSGAYTSSISTTVTMPTIPQSPTSPSAASAARVSDTQITVSWTNNSTGTAPYANVKVYRATDGGGWANIATLGAAATSYSDTGVTANHKYQYRMSAVGTNTAEVGYGTTSAVYTTPAADSGMTATKIAGGDIRVDWTVNANANGTGDLQHDLYDSPDGTTWNYLTTVFGTTATYTHVGPSTAVTHRYRTVSFPPGTTLYATSGTSNIITLLSTAGAPTGLAPSGVSRDAAGNIVLTWTHNPTDGTAQTKYQLQYKVDAGAYTTVGPTTSGVSSYTIPAATFTNGHTITWHVATAGQNGTIGAYSADASFTTSAAPTATISSPGASYTLAALTLAWTYFQAQSSAQATWAATLEQGGVTLETRNGTTESSTVFATPVANGGTYTVRITVTSAAGLTSTTTSQTFTVTYLPPAPVHVAAVYDQLSGTVVATITGDAVTVGVNVAIATVGLQRQIDGGAWVTVASGIAIPTGTAVVLDMLPTIHGTNTYRATALSATPSSTVSTTVDVVTAEDEWCFLNAGAGFAGNVLRFRAKPKIAASVSLDKALYHFAGRAAPVELAGEATDLGLSVTALLETNSSTVAEFRAVGKVAGPMVFRAPTGERTFCSLAKVGTVQAVKAFSELALTLAEVDYAE